MTTDWHHFLLLVVLLTQTPLVFMTTELRFQKDSDRPRLRQYRHFSSSRHFQRNPTSSSSTRQSSNVRRMDREVVVSSSEEGMRETHLQPHVHENHWEDALEKPQRVSNFGAERWVNGLVKPPPCLSDSVCNPDVQMSKMIRIMQIKNQILKETGLEEPPNMTGVVISQTPALQRLIDSLNEGAKSREREKLDDVFGDDPSSVREQKSFIPASSKGEDVIKIPEQLKNQYYYFKLGREHSTSIAKANLHFWLKPSPHSPHSEKAKISIMKVEPPKYANDFNRLRNISSSVVAYDASGKWETFDVFSLVREWLVDVENNLGIVVKVETLSGSSISIESLDDNPSHAPLLEIDVKEERNDRRKRFANKRMCSDTNIARECCKYPLIMDFTQYKFDFIVAPKKYVANYCRGECPFLYAQKMPHSTILNQMFPNASASTFGPCCGASNLSPLKLIYYDGKKIKVDVINEMVVNQCSCT